MVMKRDGKLPAKLEWNNLLARAAADYLKELEGCRSIPDQIFEDQDRPSDYFVRKMNLKYGNHHRVVLMPMRFPWSNPMEAVFDLLLDDNYEGTPNREALLSNDYDSVGVACNCHTRFGQICVFEFASDCEHEGEVVQNGPVPEAQFWPIEPRGDCTNQCWDTSLDEDMWENAYTQNSANTQTDIFRECCEIVCQLTTSVCNTAITARTSRNLNEELDERGPYEFRKPYDPWCPDKKRDEECNEILWDDQPPKIVNEDVNDMQSIAQNLFLEIDELRSNPQDYAAKLNNTGAKFASQSVSTAYTADFYEHNTWNEGLARAARHYLNDLGSCGTCGDINALGFK
jgi:hypothetical protein